MTLEYALKQLEHANNNVRSLSKDIIVELYKIVGEAKIRPLIINVRKKQQEMLLAEFNKISGGGNQQD